MAGVQQAAGSGTQYPADCSEGTRIRHAVGRRGILAAAGAVVAGIVAKQTSQPVRAATRDTNFVATGVGSPAVGFDASAGTFRLGVYGSGSDIGVLGTGALNGTGVLGTIGGIDSSSFHGVGVGGENINADGVAVKGVATIGNHAKGIYGVTDTGYGVVGEAGDGGWAVTGVATTAFGVIGKSTSGIGVQGEIQSSSIAANTTGVIGINYASGANGAGVWGQCDTASGGTAVGVRGTSTTGIGVYGKSATSYGVLGYTTGGSASLAGISTNANIPAFAGGNSVAGGLAASFSGTVYVNGQFVVADMTQKHGLLKHPDGSHRLMYTVEAPESGAEDFGTGTLVNGKVEVKLDPDFAALIHTGDYHVFLTGHDRSGEGLVVSARHADGFVVEERKGGKGSGTFSYRVVAKPKSDKKVERLGKFVVPNIPLPDVTKLHKPPEAAKPATKP